jgi:hypothetical protein
MRDLIRRILKEELSKDEKLDFYFEYYKNLTPTNLKLTKEDGKIIIDGFDRSDDKDMDINIFIGL